MVSSVTINQTGASGTGTSAGVMRHGEHFQRDRRVRPPTTPSPFPAGPSLDVLPTVSADEFSVQMTLLPAYTELRRLR